MDDVKVSSSKLKVNSNRCYYCGELGHWKNYCDWKDYLCVLCKNHPMKLFTSNQENTKGDKFFRCESQPLCNGFEWFSAAKKKKEEQEKIKSDDKEKITKNQGSVIKLRIEGKLGMTAEGSAEDMAALIKQLQKM